MGSSLKSLLAALAAALACLAALAAVPAASADVGVCVPPGLPGENTCVYAAGHAHGEGRCDGFADNGGSVGVVQRDPGGDRYTYVQNGCYDGEDADGSYHGSFIGVYTYDYGTGELSGYHWNAGSHDAHGDYCSIGSVDPSGPWVACPPLVRVPVILDILL